MNWDQISGRWKQWAGQAKERWGKFTDDDLTRIAGRREHLAGLLQEKYGYVREKADMEIDAFAKELKNDV